MTKEEINKLDRAKEAILFVLYMNHPNTMKKKDVEAKISTDGLLKMSDKEFEEYKRNFELTKMN
jgi:hypothetical protein